MQGSKCWLQLVYHFMYSNHTHVCSTTMKLLSPSCPREFLDPRHMLLPWAWLSHQGGNRWTPSYPSTTYTKEFPWPCSEGTQLRCWAPPHPETLTQFLLDKHTKMATISILYTYLALLILDVNFMQLDNYNEWPGAITQGSYSGHKGNF